MRVLFILMAVWPNCNFKAQLGRSQKERKKIRNIIFKRTLLTDSSSPKDRHGARKNRGPMRATCEPKGSKIGAEESPRTKDRESEKRKITKSRKVEKS